MEFVTCVLCRSFSIMLIIYLIRTNNTINTVAEYAMMEDINLNSACPAMSRVYGNISIARRNRYTGNELL